MRVGSSVDGPNEPRVLFLHGGPGFSAELERRQYASSLPIHWWDQPHIALSDPHPFESLVAACEGEVRRMSSNIGGAVSLLASSFGALLAVELMNRIPDLIGPVTFSGPSLDLRQGFARFGRHLARKRGDAAMERTATEVARESNSDEMLWTLIGMILAGPPFFDEYFAPGAAAQADAMGRLAAEGRLLHGDTFQAVLGDVVRLQVPSAPLPSARSVRVLIGRHDRFAGEGDAECWRLRFPSAVVTQVEAGHFPHLERSIVSLFDHTTQALQC